MGDEGAGGDFSLCQCIWSHEVAMTRLLNVLRNSQTLCTDTECFETGPAAPGRSAPADNLYFMTFIIGVTLFLFFFRPRAQIANETMNKPNNIIDSSDLPPPPPID